MSQPGWGLLLVSFVVGGCASDQGAPGAGTGGAPADAAACGNGVVDVHETCEPSNCPTSCEDGDPCTTDDLHGSPETCNVHCRNEPIAGCTACADECVEGVVVEGSTYTICAVHWDGDACAEPSPTFECLSEPSPGICESVDCAFPAPEISSPADGATVGGDVTICWSGVGGALGYNVSLTTSCIALDAHRATNEYCVPSGEWADVTVRGSSTTTCRDFASLAAASYFVHVQACDTSACGPWSLPRKLLVQ